MDVEACENIYGKMIKEDDNFCYFQGKGEYGVTVPKHVFWNFQPERLNPETQESVSMTEKQKDAYLACMLVP